MIVVMLQLIAKLTSKMNLENLFSWHHSLNIVNVLGLSNHPVNSLIGFEYIQQLLHSHPYRIIFYSLRIEACTFYRLLDIEELDLLEHDHDIFTQ